MALRYFHFPGVLFLWCPVCFALFLLFLLFSGALCGCGVCIPRLFLCDLRCHLCGDCPGPSYWHVLIFFCSLLVAFYFEALLCSVLLCTHSLILTLCCYFCLPFFHVLTLLFSFLFIEVFLQEPATITGNISHLHFLFYPYSIIIFPIFPCFTILLLHTLLYLSGFHHSHYLVHVELPIYFSLESPTYTQIICILQYFLHFVASFVW